MTPSPQLEGGGGGGDMAVVAADTAALLSSLPVLQSTAPDPEQGTAVALPSPAPTDARAGAGAAAFWRRQPRGAAGVSKIVVDEAQVLLILG